MKKSIISNVGIAISGVMIFTLIGKLLGFARELILAYYFGANSVSDAYLISQTIPGTLYQIVGVGITTCFVPIYLRVKNSNNPNKKIIFINKFISMVLIVSIIMIIFVFLFTKPMVQAFAMGFDQQTLDLTIVFTRISVLSLCVSGLVYSYNALLQAERKFIPASFGVIPYNIGLIIAIIVGAKVHLYALSYISSLAVCAQLFYQIIYVRRIPYKFSLNLKLNDENIKKSLSLLPPVVIGVAATEINTLVDRTIASSIIMGGITIITYSTSLFNLIIGIFSQSISNVFYPLISESIIENSYSKLENVIVKATNLILFFLIPITFGIIVMSTNIVQILFGHGSLDKSSIKMISESLILYSLGFIFYSLKQIYNNIFYAKQKTNIPMSNTIIGIVINILFNILFSRIIGLNGLALATSLSSLIIALLMYFSVRKEFKICLLPSILVILKYVFSALLMSFVCMLSLQYIHLGLLLTSFISFIIGIFTYLIMTSILGVNILEVFKAFKL